MADLIWNHIIAHDTSTEKCEEGIITFNNLIEENENSVDLQKILNLYLATYPTPRNLTVFFLSRLKRDAFTRENMLSYLSNKHIDDSSESFESMLVYMLDSKECAKDFVYQCYKRGYGFKDNSMSSIMKLYRCNKAIAEYIKYTYDNGILVDNLYVLNKEENMLDIYTKMIGDRSISNETLAIFSNNYTAPVTEELRTKVLADLERIPQFPKHADFIVPTQRLACYIGFDYEKYKKICYSNINPQIARQLSIAQKADETMPKTLITTLIDKIYT